MQPPKVEGPLPSPLGLVAASPAAVLRRDKSAWLDLFTTEATIEDPVGAGVYRGRKRHAAFWDVFIAPQREITFVPKREFVGADRVIRYVHIETRTVIADAPLVVPALVEYTVDDHRIRTLRAFWRSRDAVDWFLDHRVSGAWNLLRQGQRMVSDLGLGDAVRFGAALRPVFAPARARSFILQLVGAPRPVWLARMARATLTWCDREGTRVGPAIEAWDDIRGLGPGLDPEIVIATGDWVAAVVVGERGATAWLVRVHAGEAVEVIVTPEGR